ncbi:MAG TPA: hypothetical protein PLS31_04695 [Candidatus Sumerlaeota bacterium]|nr:MAG: hypothetical protein BWY12_01491 [candidate division BRC1 bacterium ADurb.Bin183]HQH11710.1 hypothetical protein [Candidatus Sumerlaeota bacterium]HRR30730.1 hypothetical protein [Candidatus Sumerlaeia bacterium]
MIKVECHFNDCVYFNQSPNSPGEVYCSHKEIELQLQLSRYNLKNCPLYRMDWAKKMGIAQSMKTRLKAF